MSNLFLTSLYGSDNATMNSLDIEVVTGSKHDKVKQSIQRLAAKGFIALPPTGIVVNKANNREYKTEVYVFSGDKGKRDSIVVVAQLSPEFTANLVDRWIYLENEVKSLTEQLEAIQNKEGGDKEVGSFHGYGLNQRKQNKKENHDAEMAILEKMRPLLTNLVLN